MKSLKSRFDSSLPERLVIYHHKKSFCIDLPKKFHIIDLSVIFLGTEMKTIKFGAYYMEERKTIDNLRQICNDWGLSDEKISTFVSDGGGK